MVDIPKPQSRPRLCRTCRHRRGLYWLGPRCVSPHLAPDPVTGRDQSVPCGVERALRAVGDYTPVVCGPSGYYWEPKERT